MTLGELIKSHIKQTDTVLDIGCGDKRRSRDLVCKEIITIDAWKKTNPDILINLEYNDLPFKNNSVDVALMIDFIEHISKDRGKDLLKQVKFITKRIIILLTPLWWQDNSENVNNPDLWCYNNPYDYHKSLWSEEDFVGWHRVRGINDKYFIGIYDCKEELDV